MRESGLVGSAIEQLLDRTRRSRLDEVVLADRPGAEPGAGTEVLAQETAGTDPAEATVRRHEQEPFLRCIECGEEYRGSEFDTCRACGGDGLAVDLPADLEIHTELPGGSPIPSIDGQPRLPRVGVPGPYGPLLDTDREQRRT